MEEARSANHVIEGASSAECDLPDDLHELLREAHRACINLRIAEARYARSLAVLAGGARGRRVRGASAIEVCAKALGIARQTLQPFAIIASRWSQSELNAIFEMRGAAGRPLTTSHLLCVARLPLRTRELWIRRALNEDLDVRALRERLAKSTQGSCDERRIPRPDDAK
jgi:hypothetical protein